MTGFRILLLAGAALLPAFPALAQEEGDEDIVVSATGVAQEADESGRAITSFGREEIETRQTVAVSDLLATVPGVSVSRNGPIGGVTTVRIRGAEGDHTLVLIDGVRVNDPSAPAGGYDFAHLLAGAVDRVEVLRGPNSVAWGSQAIGGVVNVTTVQPREGVQGRANAEYGSFETFGANAALSGGNEIVSGGITGGYFTSGGISAAANGSEPDGYRQYGATGRLRIDPLDGLWFDFRGYYTDGRTEYDSDFPPPTFSIVGDSGHYSTARQLNGYAGVNVELLGGRFRNRVSFSTSDIDREDFDPAAGSAPIFVGYGHSERWEYQGDFKVADQFRAVIGAEQEDSRFNEGGAVSRQDITSFYGEAIVTPVEQVTLTVGVRNDDHSGFGNHTTFGTSAAVRPLDGTVLRASYGEGFKAPTLYQRFGPFGLGTPNLLPEEAESWEVGAEQRLAAGVTIAGTWFHRDVTNQIDFDLGTFSYQNIARTRSEGVEFELVAQPVEGLSLRGAFTHLKPENRSPGANLGKDLARRPRDSGSLSADYKFGFGLNLGATLLVVGESFDNPANTVRLDGYALVGLRAEMPVSDQFSLYARVDNLFDEDYQTVANYGTMGRAAYAGVRLRFD